MAARTLTKVRSAITISCIKFRLVDPEMFDLFFINTYLTCCTRTGPSRASGQGAPQACTQRRWPRSCVVPQNHLAAWYGIQDATNLSKFSLDDVSNGTDITPHQPVVTNSNSMLAVDTDMSGHEGQASRFSVGDSMRFFADITPRISFATAVQAEWTLLEPTGGTPMADISPFENIVYKIGL